MKTITLSDLQNAATAENWTFVDEHIMDVCNDQETIDWVHNDGLFSEDHTMRDLAVSILEKTDFPLLEEDEFTLTELLENDENEHVRFRSACALAKQDIDSPTIRQALEAQLEDNQLATIAQGYINQLNQK